MVGIPANCAKRANLNPREITEIRILGDLPGERGNGFGGARNNRKIHILGAPKIARFNAFRLLPGNLWCELDPGLDMGSLNQVVALSTETSEVVFENPCATINHGTVTYRL